MKRVEKFWEQIAFDIEKEYKNGHPSTWEKEDIEIFRMRFGERLQLKCKQRPHFIEFLKLPINAKGKPELNIPSYDTFRRIFITKESNGKNYTRHLFAIYLDFQSFQDYIDKNEIKITKKVMITSKVTDREVAGKEKLRKWSPQKLAWFLIFLFLIVLISVWVYNNKNSIQHEWKEAIAQKHIYESFLNYCIIKIDKLKSNNCLTIEKGKKLTVSKDGYVITSNSSSKASNPMSHLNIFNRDSNLIIKNQEIGKLLELKGNRSRFLEKGKFIFNKTRENDSFVYGLDDGNVVPLGKVWGGEFVRIWSKDYSLLLTSKEEDEKFKSNLYRLSTNSPLLLIKSVEGRAYKFSTDNRFFLVDNPKSNLPEFYLYEVNKDFDIILRNGIKISANSCLSLLASRPQAVFVHFSP